MANDGSRRARTACMIFLAGFTTGCTGTQAPPPAVPTGPSPEYVVGPLDTLSVFVWRHPEVSVTSVPVRPDGRISTPLVEDMPAAGKTPARLGEDISKVLSQYIQNPVVTVIVTEFSGPFARQVRVVGEAVRPQAIAYRDDMTVLDVMVAVGGMTEFAAGNRASIVRRVEGEQKQYRVRLGDLLRSGDVSANVPVMPGDIIIIPESWF